VLARSGGETNCMSLGNPASAPKNDWLPVASLMRPQRDGVSPAGVHAEILVSA